MWFVKGYMVIFYVEVKNVINKFIGEVFSSSKQLKKNFRKWKGIKMDIVGMLRFLKDRYFFGKLLLLRNI